MSEVLHGPDDARHPLDTLANLSECVGGLFVGIAAPEIFSGHDELTLSAILCCALVAAILPRPARPGPAAWSRRGVAWLAVVLLAGHEVWIAVNPDPVAGFYASTPWRAMRLTLVIGAGALSYGLVLVLAGLRPRHLAAPGSVQR